MARVTGPLMSMEASGSIGKALTFANWVGRPYVRRWATPSNPQTEGQVDGRNRFSAVGKAASWASMSAQTVAATSKTFQEIFEARTPSGMRWNGYLLRILTSGEGAEYKNAMLAWEALTEPQQGDWDTAAGLTNPPVPSAPQKLEGGLSGDSISRGNVLFLIAYAAYLTGDISVPGGTPVTLT